MVAAARAFALSNLGVTDPSLLSSDFVCSGPSFNNIGKSAYLSGLTKETAAFQRAMPNFDLRPYSFSVDETKPDTVWFKIRPQGTLTGPFTYKGEVYLPNQKLVELPAQQLSLTIRSGKVTRFTAGYIIDRFTGNTGGLAGPAGILFALGAAPSKFSYTPLAVVIRNFFSRTKKLVKRKAASVSPFPAAVMISLAKRLVETALGSEEPSLLSTEFQFSGPLVGPLSKEEFVHALSSFNLKTPFPDLNSENYNFEVDSYEPERVWVITKGSGTQTGPLTLGGKTLLEPSGNSYEGPPEAVSVSFNEKGLCYRATGGYILDKDVGNTNGLGGVYGVFEAIGSPVPWWESRTVGELPGLWKKAIFRFAILAQSKISKAIKSPPKAPSVAIEASPIPVADNIIVIASPSIAPKPVLSKAPATQVIAPKPVFPKIPAVLVPPKTVEKKETQAKATVTPEPVKVAAPSFFSFMKPGNAAPTSTKSPPVKDTVPPVSTTASKKAFTAPKLSEKPSPIAPKPVLPNAPATPVIKTVEKKENRAKATELPVTIKAAAIDVKNAAPSFLSFMKPGNASPTSTKSPSLVKATVPPVSTTAPKKSSTTPKLFEKPSPIAPKPVLSKAPATQVTAPKPVFPKIPAVLVPPKTVEKKENQAKATVTPEPAKAATVAAPSFFSFMKPGNAAPTSTKSPPVKDTVPPVSTTASKKAFTAPKLSEKPAPRVPPVAQAPKKITSTKETTVASALTKPTAFGGMFSMEISKGKIGKNSVSAPKK